MIKIDLIRDFDGDFIAFDLTFCKLEILFKTVEYWNISEFYFQSGNNITDDADLRREGFKLELPTLDIGFIYL